MAMKDPNVDDDIRALLLSAEPANTDGGFVAEHRDKVKPVKLSPYWTAPFKPIKNLKPRGPAPVVGAAPAGRGAAAAAEIRRRYNAGRWKEFDCPQSRTRNRSPVNKRAATPGADWRIKTAEKAHARPETAPPLTHTARDGYEVAGSDSPCQGCGYGEPDVCEEFGIPPVVCRQLEAHLKAYSDQGQLKPGEACVIVEHCHRCEEHNSISLRHDEQKYKTACSTILQEVQKLYPSLKCYAMGCCLLRGASRVGALEVYLCCLSPALMSEALELRGGYVVRRLFSKLQMKYWPPPHFLDARLTEVMPQVPVRIVVKTVDGAPLTGIIVKGRQEKTWDQREEPDVKREVLVQTDSNGVCEVWVQVCSLLALDVHHPILMKPQEKILDVDSACAVHFTAETVAEIWQKTTAEMLIVYAAPPQLGTAVAAGQQRALHPPKEGLVHFEGFFEGDDGVAVELDSVGCLRCMGDPLAGLQEAFCQGWKSCEVHPTAVAAGGLLELARLKPPHVEISVITACCHTPVVGARVYINSDAVGYTDSKGSYDEALSVGVYTVRVEHALCPEGIERELVIDGPMTSGLEIQVIPSELQLVCTDLSPDCIEVRLTLARRAEASHTIPFEGTVGCGNSSCQVRNGRVDWTKDFADFSKSLGEDADLGNSRVCPFSAMVLEEVTSEPEYWPILARQSVSGCAVLSAAGGSFPVVGQLTRKVLREPNEPVRICCKGSCCSLGWEGVNVCVDGVNHSTSGYGDVNVECDVFDQLVPVRIGNGAVKEADMCLQEQYSGLIQVLFSCQVFVYVLDPDEDDEDDASEPEDRGPPPKPEATVWICGNESQIPDEARTVKGILHTPGARIPEQRLQGERFGPLSIIRHPDDDPDSCCLLADATFVPDEGSYRAKDPSPLTERCEELGGCEFQRLVECPVIIGFLSVG